MAKLPFFFPYDAFKKQPLPRKRIIIYQTNALNDVEKLPKIQFTPFWNNKFLSFVNLVGAFSTIPLGKPERLSWGNASFYNFLLLHEGVSASAVEAKIATAATQHIPADRLWFDFKVKPLRDIHLYSRGFLKLVLVAFLVATPIAWFVMNRWLANFSYRIDIQWYVFVIAGTLALFITMLTVSFQSIKATLTNPVDSLKME